MQVRKDWEHGGAYKQALYRAGRSVIDAALLARKGGVALAASDLGMHRSTLYALIQTYSLADKHGIKPKSWGNKAWQELGRQPSDPELGRQAKQELGR